MFSEYAAGRVYWGKNLNEGQRMRCEQCGLPLSPIRKDMVCPQCGAPQPSGQDYHAIAVQQSAPTGWSSNREGATTVVLPRLRLPARQPEPVVSSGRRSLWTLVPKMEREVTTADVLRYFKVRRT